MSVMLSDRIDSSSLPALTRASTALNSNQSNLPTPGDDASGFACESASKIVRMPVDLGQIRQQSSTISDRAVLSGSRVVGSVQSIPQESDTSYFPIPAAPSPHTPVRKRSARELIKRYESMSAGSRTPSRCSSIQEECPSSMPMQRPISALKAKGRSPLRNSFLNLMTLFTKKKGKDGDTTTIGSPYEASIASTPPVIVHNSPRPDAGRITKDSISHTGPVLYLSLPDSGSALPVWTNCKASLLQDRIVLDWHTAFGNPASKVIILDKSADVHSLATVQVDPTEKNLLPNMGQDLHIFEITFVTGPPEKFALPSVAERSSWVSSIWDTLLHIGSDTIGGRSSNSSLPSTPSGSVLASDECQEQQEDPNLSTKASALTQQGSYISARASVSGKEETKVLQSGLMPTPPTPTKSMLLTQNTSMKRCTPSTQSLGHTSLVQAQLSRFSTSEKVSDHHEPVALSRCSTAESRHSSPSRRPSVPLTPRSMPRNRAEAHADEVPEAEPKQLVEDAIYDFYVQNDSEERKLPPLPIPSDPHFPKDGPSRSEDIFSPRGHFRSERPYTLRAVSDRRDVLAQEHLQSLEDTVHPLVALIQDHAVQQYSQTADLGHQIASLRNDVLTMSSELRMVISDQKPDSDLRQILEGLCSRMEKSLTSDTSDVLRQLGTKVDLVQSSIAQFSDNPKLMPEVILPEVTTLRNLGNSEKEQDTKMLLRKIDEKIDRIQQDIKIPSNENTQLEPTALSDMKTDVVSRLTELISLVKNAQEKKEGTKATVSQVENTEMELKPTDDTSNGDTVADSDPVNRDEKLLEILEILKEEKEQKKTSTEQQAENARYLQELNTWLETFVNNGTSQIQRIASGVDDIRKELSPQGGGQDVKDPAKGDNGVRLNLQEIMATVKDNNQKTVVLQATLKDAIDSKAIAEEQKTPDMEAIIGIIEKQRAEQEHMLRGIATELSNDIRGERLRFVEAMKEATAINVQVHVEEFKKELSREVMAMTCEVGRLQRERQVLEQQIADLFAFFAKQRAEMEQASRLQMPQQSPSRAATLRRPLPTPK